VEYWLNAKPEDPVAFAAEVAAVCEVYQHAPAVAQQGGHIISTDEKTGIQALERAAPTLPLQPGLVERPEYEYRRHGTQCLIANFDVATGRVVAPTIGPSRTEEDFAGHIAQTIATDRACGITEDLGEKEKRGLLQSMQTRAAFLSDASHRIRFLYTPKHTSWLNQIELWFSILVRRLLNRGNFTSVVDLRERILAFITYFNKTMAKPFKWTYKGRPLTV
jgi:DDE superfamily endonuclease